MEIKVGDTFLETFYDTYDEQDVKITYTLLMKAESSDGTIEYFAKQVFHDSMYVQHVVVTEEQILEDFTKL